MTTLYAEAVFRSVLHKRYCKVFSPEKSTAEFFFGIFMKFPEECFCKTPSGGCLWLRYYIFSALCSTFDWHQVFWVTIADTTTEMTDVFCPYQYNDLLLVKVRKVDLVIILFYKKKIMTEIINVQFFEKACQITSKDLFN